MRKEILRTTDIDPTQPWLDGMPSRFPDYEYSELTAHLESLLQDPTVPPYIKPGSPEEEKVLTTLVEPEKYLRWARIHAFLPKGPDGQRPKRFINKEGELATPSEILIQEKKVCEV